MSFPSVVMISGEPYLRTLGYVWDPGTLAWVVAQQAGSGGGGGGASTIADGADVTQGAKADTVWDGAAASPTAQAVLKYQGAKLEAIRTLLAASLTVGLPTGASTSALQTTGNTSLASIDGKTPALGQALAAGSVPVVLTALQLAALTPPAAITGFALDATVAKDGADITGSAMPAGGAGIRGWLSAIYTKLAASIAVTGTFWQTTQPVSLATNTPDVTDRSARLLGHVTVDSAPTTAITASTLPLPANAAQETGGNLVSIATSEATLVARTIPGQAQGIASIPVVFALDQTSIDGRLRRQAAELATIEAMDPMFLALRGRSAERVTLADARGRYHRGTAR